MRYVAYVTQWLVVRDIILVGGMEISIDSGHNLEFLEDGIHHVQYTRYLALSLESQSVSRVKEFVPIFTRGFRPVTEINHSQNGGVHEEFCELLPPAACSA